MKSGTRDMLLLGGLAGVGYLALRRSGTPAPGADGGFLGDLGGLPSPMDISGGIWGAIDGLFAQFANLGAWAVGQPLPGGGTTTPDTEREDQYNAGTYNRDVRTAEIAQANAFYKAQVGSFRTWRTGTPSSGGRYVTPTAAGIAGPVADFTQIYNATNWAAGATRTASPTAGAEVAATVGASDYAAWSQNLSAKGLPAGEVNRLATWHSTRGDRIRG